METLVNPNQILNGGGGSGEATKILNVVQVGTLKREGTVFSGFSSSAILKIGSRIDKGILSLDTTTNIKYFNSYTPTANTWAFVTKIHYIQDLSARQGIFYQSVSYGSGLEIYTDGKFRLQVSNTTGSASIGTETGTTVLTDNTDYWIKIEFTGSAYKAYLSTDGTTWNEECSITSDVKLIDRAEWQIGRSDNTARYLLGSLDIGETYIKINGEYWWKGVEEINVIVNGVEPTPVKQEKKLVNIVETGALARNGSVYSGFSGSNYLTIGGIYNGGIFSPEAKVQGFSGFFSSADSWEVNGSFKFEDTTLNEYEVLFTGSGQPEGIYLVYYGNTNQVTIDYGINGNWIEHTISETLIKGTKYYFRFAFNGEDYKFYFNTDGQTYDNTTLKDTYTNAAKVTDTNHCVIGLNATTSSSHPAVHAQIDLADWNIKKNGELFWQGIETF